MDLTLPSGKPISSLKVTTLQRELGKRRLSKVGKKTELIERLAEFLRESGDVTKKDEEDVQTKDTPAEQDEMKADTPHSSKKKKVVRRRSHTRLNETFEFEMVEAEMGEEDGSDTAKDNLGSVAVTPVEGKRRSRSRGRPAKSATATPVVDLDVGTNDVNSFLSEDGDGEKMTQEYVPCSNPHDKKKDRRRTSAIRRSILAKLDQAAVKPKASSTPKKEIFHADAKGEIEGEHEMLSEDEPECMDTAEIQTVSSSSSKGRARSKSIGSSKRNAVSKTPTATSTTTPSRPEKNNTPAASVRPVSLAPRTPSSMARPRPTGSTGRGLHSLKGGSSAAKNKTPASMLGPLYSENSPSSREVVEEKKMPDTSSPAKMPRPIVAPGTPKSVSRNRLATPKSGARRSVAAGRLAAVDTGSKSIKKEKAPAVNRFAAQHSKQMEKMLTIEQHRDLVADRHEKYNKQLPDVVKRLATPKSVSKRVPLSQRNAAGTSGSVSTSLFHLDPMAPIGKDAFQFGNTAAADMSTVQKKVGAIPRPTTATLPSRDTNIDKRLDAKQRSKAKKAGRVPIPLTVPVDTTVVNYLAAPKGATPAKTPVRSGYTPHRGTLKFIDTTKLSDREFALAVEEGLIDTKAKGRRPVENASVAKMNRKSRRDEILSVKRKLNI